MYFIGVGHRNDRAINDRHRDARVMRPMSFPRERLSTSVDLRRWMTPIEDQEDLNTCVANAYAGICEYLIKRHLKRHIDVSRLFIYYNGQIIGQRTLRVTDRGSNQKDIALGIRKYGICEEKLWPYDPDLVNKEPSAKAYEEASKYTVILMKIPYDVESILTCLHNQIPVMVGIKLMEDVHLDLRRNNGYLTVPNVGSTFYNKTMSHAVLVVGYDQETKHFIVRNSWGTQWGKEGYFYMPFDYINQRHLVHPTDRKDGLWAITEIVPRRQKLPTVRHFVLSNNQTTNQSLTTQPQIRPRPHHRHHHHHRR